ncbi:MAG: alpha/beta hydrolase [Actinomycetota bacterium]|nr:alpha/beta hydrolase [Actinomycetota bacterium]
MGETYADLYPSHIRAMVLDGVLNPTLDGVDFATQQAAGLDQQLSAFLTWCAARTCSWHPGGDLHAAYDSLMSRIGTSRIPGVGSRTVGPGEAFLGVVQNLFAPEEWPSLAEALSKASAGDGSLLLKAFDTYAGRAPDGSYSNGIEANNAIECLDGPWPHDPTVVMQAAAKAKQQAPEFGVDNIYSGLICSFWPVPPTGRPHPISAAGSPPIVVVGTTGDPITPYPLAQAVAAQLASARLITRQGNGHTAYRSSQCVRNAVDAYFISSSVPAAGLNCPTP